MLTVGKFAFNRARTRHQAPGISSGKFSRDRSLIFFFTFFSFSIFLQRSAQIPILRNAPRLFQEILGLTVRHPSMMAVLAVAQMTFPGCEGFAVAAVHRAANGLQSKTSASL